LINLSLNEEEVVSLLAVLYTIGGHPDDTPRKYIDTILDKLYENDTITNLLSVKEFEDVELNDENYFLPINEQFEHCVKLLKETK